MLLTILFIAYKMPQIAHKVNVTGTSILIQACQSEPNPPRFAFASSYSVFGPSNSDKEKPLLTPSSPVNPVDSYGKHKVMCEKYLHENYTRGRGYCILRLGAVSVQLTRALLQPPTPETDKLLYGIPHNQRRHGVHSRDVGRAFVNAVTMESKDAVNGKVFLIGGDASWCIRSHHMLDVVYGVLGFGKANPLDYRIATTDNSWYFEDWMDTTESQRILQFQQMTFEDWARELGEEVKGMSFFQRKGMRLLAPIIRWTFHRKSRHYLFNKNGKKDPLSDKPMDQVVENAS